MLSSIECHHLSNRCRRHLDIVYKEGEEKRREEEEEEEENKK
jgi:hypothetical protein